MRAIRSLFVMFALAACAMGLVACSSIDDYGTARNLTGDDAIEMQIRSALSEDPVTRMAVIPVSVRGGIVTLRGNVKEPSVRMRAESIARGTTGVVSVENQILQSY